MLFRSLFKAAGYNLLVVFFPAYLELAYRIPKEDAASMASWSLVGAVAGSLLGGWVIDGLQRRTNSKRVSRCWVALASMFLTAVLMAAACLTTNATELALVMAVAALVTGVGNSCPWAAIMDIGGKNTAVAMGFLNCGACLAGVLITPLVGRLIDHLRDAGGDWNLVIYIHAAFYVAAGLCWFAIDPDRPLDRAETSHAVRHAH